MQTTKKKPSLIFILVGAVLAGYLGYLINGAWTEGIAFNEFMDRFNEVCAVPFANYYNSNTVKAVAIALGIYAMAIVMYYTSQRNYMPGKEFGTARFENPKQVNKILADKDENFNRILSQNVKMSLDFRRLKLNGNILICGGSGAGKTFYEVKPNLMQMPHNCSFICTDPKGEILRSCGQMLKNNGYNLKVINLLEMDKSDCYNPFSYIREETDVVKLITNLISNTTPKGATPSDPFWEKAEGLFLQAIFYYVWLEVQPAKRNFETVLKLLGEAEVTEQGKASKLDVRMKFLEESSPLGANHPAVKQYNKCMRGAGDAVQKSIAHYAVKQGANLVLGHHPHVLQGIEKYKGAYIVYSLANFCFGGNTNPPDKDTMIYQQTFTFKKNKLQKSNDVKIIPCKVSSTNSINNYQPTPAKGKAKKKILAKMNRYCKPFNVHFKKNGKVGR